MLLDVQDLHVSYGAIHAVQGISFTVDEGEIVTLIGANGAGKSTTLKTISGLLRPKGGHSAVQRPGPDRPWPPTRSCAWASCTCPKAASIFATLTVRENLEMGAYTRSRQGRDRPEHGARLSELSPPAASA